MEYIKNEAWEEFYEELEPEKRKEIMEKVLSEAEDDGANELRQKLFIERHQPKKRGPQTVDNGIWHMIIMPSNMSLQYRLTPGTKGEIRRSMKDLGVADVDKTDKVLVSAVYWEIRNIAKRYFSTCNGPEYYRKLFGILKSSDEEKLIKTAEDVWACAVGVPEQFKMKDEMTIFSDAVRDEFIDYFPDGEDAYNSVLKRKSRD